jgi:hypothetical protein
MTSDPVLIVKRRMNVSEWDTNELRLEAQDLMGKYEAVSDGIGSVQNFV